MDNIIIIIMYLTIEGGDDPLLLLHLPARSAGVTPLTLPRPLIIIPSGIIIIVIIIIIIIAAVLQFWHQCKTMLRTI